MAHEDQFNQEVKVTCFADAVSAFGVTSSRNPFAQQAKGAYCQGTNDIEVDDETMLSEGDEGTWVMAWLWVPRSDVITEPKVAFQAALSALTRGDVDASLVAARRADVDQLTDTDRESLAKFEEHAENEELEEARQLMQSLAKH